MSAPLQQGFESELLNTIPNHAPISEIYTLFSSEQEKNASPYIFFTEAGTVISVISAYLNAELPIDSTVSEMVTEVISRL